MRIIAVIPARWASSRFPGKPLATIAGRPMIEHVWDVARAAEGIDAVVVATDDARVADAVRGFGGEAMMTRGDHTSGTDRIAEVATTHPADAYINLQGDEPLARPRDIAALAALLRADAGVVAATLCHAIDAAEARDPNRVKLVRDAAGDALYFSRAAIPFARDAAAARYLQHVGVYALRRDVLIGFAGLPRPAEEIAESLEQLRLLAAGIRIRAIEVAPTGPGVDTPEDLLRVEHILSGAADAMPPIRLVIADVDGVMTDGGLYYDASGEALKRFDVRDGLGIVRLKAAGIAFAVVSGRDSAALRARLRELGVGHARLGVGDKAAACAALQAELGVGREATAAIGDDLPDLALLAGARLSFAPADAVPAVRAAAGRVLAARGGHGALREAIEIILAGE